MTELEPLFRYPELGSRDEPPNYRILSRAEEDDRASDITLALNQLATFMAQRICGEEIVSFEIRDAFRDYVRDTLFYTPMSVGSHHQHVVLFPNVDGLEIDFGRLGYPQIWSGQARSFDDRSPQTGIILPELQGRQKTISGTPVVPDIDGHIVLKQNHRFDDIDIEALRICNKSDAWQLVCDALLRLQQELTFESQDELDTSILESDKVATKVQRELIKSKDAYEEAEQGAKNQITALAKALAEEEAVRIERRRKINELNEHRLTHPAVKKPKTPKSKSYTDPQIEVWSEQLKILSTQVVTYARQLSILQKKITGYSSRLNEIKFSGDKIATTFLDNKIASVQEDIDKTQKVYQDAQDERVNLQNKLTKYKSDVPSFYATLSTSAEKRAAHKQYWELRLIHEEFSRRAHTLALLVAGREKSIERLRNAIQQTENTIALSEREGDYKVIKNGIGRAKRKKDYTNLSRQKLALVPLLIQSSSDKSRLSLIYKHAAEASSQLADFIETYKPQDRPFSKVVMQEIRKRAKKHIYGILNPQVSYENGRSKSSAHDKEKKLLNQTDLTPEVINNRKYLYLLATMKVFRKAANEASKKQKSKINRPQKIQARVLRIETLIRTKQEAGTYDLRFAPGEKSASFKRDKKKLLNAQDAFLKASHDLFCAQKVFCLVGALYNDVMDELTSHVAEHGKAGIVTYNPVHVDIKRRARANADKSLQQIALSVRSALHFVYSNDH